MTTNEKKKAAFCPACGAASIERNLIGGTASCRVCPWSGHEHELAAAYFEVEGDPSDEQMMHRFFLDMRGLLAEKFAKEILGLLLRWGFMGAPDPKLLARYLAAVSKATVRALIDERGNIEKELHGKS